MPALISPGAIPLPWASSTSPPATAVDNNAADLGNVEFDVKMVIEDHVQQNHQPDQVHQSASTNSYKSNPQSPPMQVVVDTETSSLNAGHNSEGAKANVQALQEERQPSSSPTPMKGSSQHSSSTNNNVGNGENRAESPAGNGGSTSTAETSVCSSSDEQQRRLNRKNYGCIGGGKRARTCGNTASTTSSTLERIWERANRYFKGSSGRNAQSQNDFQAQALFCHPCAVYFASHENDSDGPTDSGFVALHALLGLSPQRNGSTPDAGHEPCGLASSAKQARASRISSTGQNHSASATAGVDGGVPGNDISLKALNGKKSSIRNVGGSQNEQKENFPAQAHRSHEDIEVLPNHKVQVRLPPKDHPDSYWQDSRKKGSGKDSNSKRAPLDSLEVRPDEAAELARSISELTMRSSYAATAEASSLNKIPDNRRMAYYAVGRHHRQSGRGGNRRCYFTGKLILGGAPFYAGSVQQGLRTLVVFCLPSALGLPRDVPPAYRNHHNHVYVSGSGNVSLSGSRIPTGASLAGGSTVGTSAFPSSNASSSHHYPHSLNHPPHHSPYPLPPIDMRGQSGTTMSHPSRASTHGSTAGRLTARSQKRALAVAAGGSSVASKSMSRLSSLDDLSLSIEGDLDPNWTLDRDYLLSVLPPASATLVKQMSELYPDQFETLPIQVRDFKKWKLYVKFCFFSGLPIAEGEMHYNVRDDIAEAVYGEEIVLSHEVMEAVNGDSAEILTLPNLKTFRYLRKHYAQQCGKLDEKVFRRACWERVAPEV